MSRVAVVGGGAAGMACAAVAAGRGHEVVLYEKNGKLGKKLFITGKGRCNLTNACGDPEEFLDHVVSGRKFLYSAFYGFSNQDAMEWFENLGLPLKTERGDRVFPMSDHSSDVIRALSGELERRHVKICLGREVLKVLTDGGGSASGVLLADGRRIGAEKVILATGGLSYQSTGSTGDGYRMAALLGHHVTPLYPSLVPLVARESFVKELQGLSLKNVSVTVRDKKKILYEGFGEMLFTHYGLSGPLILSASSYAAPYLEGGGSLTLSLDLKPALSEQALLNRLDREFQEKRGKQFKNAVSSFFPSKLTPVMVKLSGIRPDKKVQEITEAQKRGFAERIKGLEITVTGLRGYDEAIITKGGVCVKEVNPSTMESKLVKGLYFAGEVLDLDALTGGFNLQIAWSTAYAAGTGIE